MNKSDLTIFFFLIRVTKRISRPPMEDGVDGDEGKMNPLVYTAAL